MHFRQPGRRQPPPAVDFAVSDGEKVQLAGEAATVGGGCGGGGPPGKLAQLPPLISAEG